MEIKLGDELTSFLNKTTFWQPGLLLLNLLKCMYWYCDCGSLSPALDLECSISEFHYLNPAIFDRSSPATSAPLIYYEPHFIKPFIHEDHFDAELILSNPPLILHDKIKSDDKILLIERVQFRPDSSSQSYFLALSDFAYFSVRIVDFKYVCFVYKLTGRPTKYTE